MYRIKDLDSKCFVTAEYPKWSWTSEIKWAQIFENENKAIEVIKEIGLAGDSKIVTEKVK